MDKIINRSEGTHELADNDQKNYPVNSSPEMRRMIDITAAAFG